jgi:putative protease
MGKVKKAAKKKRLPAGREKPAGEITHFFSNISVAVIKLSSPLKIGDKIRIAGGQETDFEQKVDSMQIDHIEVKSAKKGSSIGIKVKERARDGYKIYKV